jgi:Arc/MetJ-type ribon-helix-helix transcriptional regulator
MPIELEPETERLVQEEIRNGHFHSVDELIVEGVHAWREKQETQLPGPPGREQTLSEFLMESPVAGSGLELERDKDSGRTIDL